MEKKVSEENLERAKEVYAKVWNWQKKSNRLAEIAQAIHQAEQRGFERMRERAVKVANETDNIEAKGDTYFAQLGDASATKYAITQAIQEIQYEEENSK